MRIYKYKDITGMRFGRLVALYPVRKRDASKTLFWHCRCDCGAEKDINGHALRNGSIVSCGCYNKEVVSRMNFKHGHRKRHDRNLTYKTWDKMMSRCYNKKCPEYKFYGARGITVEESWHDFANFLKDMGERKSKDLSLDRIDFSKGYCKDNCRWADKYTQANNTSRNIHVKYKGKDYTIAELSRISGIPYDTVYSRITKYGWKVENAISIPASKSNNKKGY